MEPQTKIALFIVACFVLAGLINTCIGHYKHRLDDDSKESHDNWNDNDLI
jgi:hypothetical protein